MLLKLHKQIKNKEMIKNYEPVVEKIRQELYNYVKNAGLKSLILGISGGIDSALTAALAKPVCDKLEIPLIGRSITIETNKADEIQRAADIGKHFVTDFQEIDLTKGFKELLSMITENETDDDKSTLSYKLRQGNVKARVRMIYLYDLASKYKGMVLSTDNYTELLIGFWTLHGDVGDYGIIQSLWKTEVYEMSKYLASMMDEMPKKALLSCVDAVPTDGLGITNSDLDQIKAKSYQEVDEILLKVINNEELGEFENHPVVLRKLRSEFKRNNPYMLKREDIVSE